MIRACGAMLLLLSACTLGFAMRSAARRPLELLHRAMEILRFIRRRIELFNTPLDALFTDAPQMQGQPLTRETLDRLTNAMGEDGDALRAFLASLGRGYREETLRLCDYTLDALEERCQLRAAELPARLKLWFAVPILFALSLLVLLW